MIIAIEGPDRCGKTTLFRQIDFWQKLQLPVMSRGLFEHIEELERFELAFWNCLYNPNATICTDRSIFVSGRVYAKLYGRPEVDATMWFDEVCIAYLDAPLSLLKSRCDRPDENFDDRDYPALLELYEEELRRWPRVLRLDAGRPTEALAKELRTWVSNLPVLSLLKF